MIEAIKRSKKTPLIVTGPSGVGKSTFVDKLIQQSHPGIFKQTVNYTSRQPRPNEIDGKDYYFISPEQFQKKIENFHFIEYQNHYQTYYGSCKNEALNIITKDKKIPVFVIDIKGAVKIIENIDNVDRIFIKPPSIKILRERLLLRGTETPEKIEQRIAKAYDEVEFIEKSKIYRQENIIVNDDFETSYEYFLRSVNKLCRLQNVKNYDQFKQQQQKQQSVQFAMN